MTDQMPEIRFTTVHGQMPSSDLDERMNNFYDGKFDVLVATTIIENGLDVPNANTMFINNAQNFGLSDLHKMRGRVGRSNKKAFCYFHVNVRVPTNSTDLSRENSISIVYCIANLLIINI